MREINIDENLSDIKVEIDANINRELNRLINYQSVMIDETNINDIQQELLTASSIIEEIHTMEYQNLRNLGRLQFVYNSLSLNVQKYEIESEIEILDKITKKVNRDLIILEEKQNDLKKEQETLEEKQNELENQYIKAEEKNNNLVYNLLGFLTAFSIVSAVVGVVSQINGILNLMIFIVFTMLILVTTLIALHNFYENNNKRESKLQDNYFIWKVLAIIFAMLLLVSGIKYIINNKENIFTYIDNKIEKVVEQKVSKELD